MMLVASLLTLGISITSFILLQFLIFPHLLGDIRLGYSSTRIEYLNELLFWNSSTPPRLETMDWAKRLNSVLFGILVPLAVLYLEPQVLWAWALAYTLVDMGVGIWFRGLMPNPMILHHIFMAAAIIVQWTHSYRHDLASMILLTELSTPFLNFRYI
jgi:hypothetical protein